MRPWLVASALFISAAAARAADSTVTLAVHHADCVLCGTIVKGTLMRVKGVKSVHVDQPDAMSDVAATITFDSQLTSVPALIAATARAGYPADATK